VNVDCTSQCSSSAGMAYAIAVPAGAIINDGWVSSCTVANVTGVGSFIVQPAPIPLKVTGIPLHTIPGSPGPDRIWFTVTNGSVAGNCTLQILLSPGATGTATLSAGAKLDATQATSV
jgi:hypothetical protein